MPTLSRSRNGRYNDPMNTYTIASIVLSLAVLIAYLNHRFIRIPASIAIMFSAICISLTLILLEQFTDIHVVSDLSHLLFRTDFHNLLLNGMLSFLLFAGAMHIDLSLLKSERWEIAALSLVSTLTSALLVGYSAYYLLPLIGLPLPLIDCLLFGALISPTDPIAVLSIIKEVNAPKRLQTIISGESLFNDGVAIVLFVTLLSLKTSHTSVHLNAVLTLFLHSALGGIAFGTILGGMTTLLLRQCREINIIILTTIAVVTGGYHLALSLNVSGPLAMVVAGIIVGNGIHRVFAEVYCKQVMLFWDIIDELLNAALFLLIGFEMLVIHATATSLIAMLAAIPVVLLARLITVGIPIRLINLVRHQMPLSVRVLTWGGLRGGLAIALVLSLPHNDHRELILAMTYSVVVFSILIQGLTMKPLARRATHASHLVKE